MNERSQDLDALRKRIDELDAELVNLLNERTRHAMNIGALKRSDDGEVYVPMREKQVLDRVSAFNQGPLPEESLWAIYREIMSASISLERDLHIAHFGQSGTFTHHAARSRFGTSVRYLSCPTIPDVFDAVNKRVADYGVVPIENSTEGPVNATLDELTMTPLHIYAEIMLPIAHHLMTAPDAGDIAAVYSHPQVFGQCRKWLAENLPQAELIPTSSTARAAERVAVEPGAGAIASSLAAELHGLRIREANIEDQAGNATRFLVLSRSMGEATGNDKTSICFTVMHKTGALYEALAPFHAVGLNLTKIESRPSRLKAWEYWFFVDFEGHAEEKGVKEALAALREHCTQLSVLGSYPGAKLDAP